MPATGDDSPARGLWRYVRRMSGRHQIGLCLPALVVAALDLAPVELQRRLVDDAVIAGDMGLLVTLGLAWFGVAVAHRGTKAVLRLYQTWVAESAILHTRAHSPQVRVAGLDEDDGAGGASGRTAVVLGSEIDKLGGFVGAGLSEAATDIAILGGLVAYMFWTEPAVAAVAMALLAPQVLIAPLLQRRIDRLTSRQARLGRALGARAGEDERAVERTRRVLPRLYANKLALAAAKAMLKALLNLLSHLGPLAVLGFGGWMAIRG